MIRQNSSESLAPAVIGITMIIISNDDRYEFGSLEVTRREGEEWGWDAQLEVRLRSIVFIMMRMVHKHHSEHSGGVIEGGDQHPLIGREQSRRKGESLSRTKLFQCLR